MNKESVEQEAAEQVLHLAAATESSTRMFLELIRFSHTVFALPFALFAALLAARVPLPNGSAVNVRWRELIGILACMVLARSAAMAFNRIVDRDVDAKNPRTKERHLPAGKISLNRVLTFCCLCSLGFIAATTLFLPNWLPLVLSVPVLMWLFGYSYAKRFTAAAHLWLGTALAASPLCAWIALRGPSAITSPNDLIPPLILSAAVALWVAGFDIIYACQDANFDLSAGLHSVPARVGVDRALRWSAWLHCGMGVFLTLLPFTDLRLGLGWMYAIALIGVLGLLIFQHSLVRPDDLQRVGLAFFEVNAVISLLLMSCAALDSWLG